MPTRPLGERGGDNASTDIAQYSFENERRGPLAVPAWKMNNECGPNPHLNTAGTTSVHTMRMTCLMPARRDGWFGEIYVPEPVVTSPPSASACL